MLFDRCIGFNNFAVQPISALRATALGPQLTALVQTRRANGARNRLHRALNPRANTHSLPPFVFHVHPGLTSSPRTRSVIDPALYPGLPDIAAGVGLSLAAKGGGGRSWGHLLAVLASAPSLYTFRRIPAPARLGIVHMGVSPNSPAHGLLYSHGIALNVSACHSATSSAESHIIVAI